MKPWAGTYMPIHLLTESGLAACGGPFANYQWGSKDVADVTCDECLATR